MSRNDKARLRRRTVGYVFQDFNLLPGLTAAENVALPLELDGMSARRARAAGLQTLDELGLAERAAQFPDELSGGERQRVAIARALVGEHRLLLADEPSGALDSVNAEAVMRLTAQRVQAGRGRGGGHPRRPAGLLGRPGRVPARRSRGGPDRARGRPGIAAQCWPGGTAPRGPGHGAGSVTATLQQRPAGTGTGNGGVPPGGR